MISRKTTKKEKPLGGLSAKRNRNGIISLIRNEVKAECESAEGKKRDTRMKFGANERRKRNASLTTCALNKEDPDRIRSNGHTDSKRIFFGL